MKIVLPLPVGEIVAIVLVSIYPGDGTHGSVVFDALNADDGVVGQPARGALLAQASARDNLVDHAIDAAYTSLLG